MPLLALLIPVAVAPSEPQPDQRSRSISHEPSWYMRMTDGLTTRRFPCGRAPFGTLTAAAVLLQNEIGPPTGEAACDGAAKASPATEAARTIIRRSGTIIAPPR